MRSRLASSLSFFRASSSIFLVMMLLSSTCRASGLLSCCRRMRDAASSIRSMALSGRNLSVKYRCERVAAATSAPSVTCTPWCTSYFSLSPRRMLIVSSTVGSSTMMAWNLLASAASFSMYFLYSSTVVAPHMRRLPRARAGLSMLPASIDPSALPRPSMVCSSSTNSMTLPLLSSTSFSTAFSLSSNSPLYLLPATSCARSSPSTLLFLMLSGTSPNAMRCASPSTMAVLPTPGSPMSTGLFLVRLDNTCRALLISSSRPITGSSLPSSASCVRSVLYFFSASPLAPACGLTHVLISGPLA
eukprot:comp21743_c0_seq1/m.30787 comp21743_c0_seq1/g.30787  ORF comp21743_c0_seq1/g.30787 comp21743_c0_seq1/m.30787 type:complete len:302 (+) comp21743_c0_seq1:1654-2559(+)